MFKTGDKVIFGNQNGERTKGTVLKVNPSTIQVRQDEPRGTQKSYPIGTKWKVPHSFCQLDTGTTAAPTLATPTPFFKQPAQPTTNSWKIGDRVEFNVGHKTVVGAVKSVNQTTISVQPDNETRYWRVSPSLLRASTVEKSMATPKRTNDAIMADIVGQYCRLSPENLSCDGERSRPEMNRVATVIRRRLRELFSEFGRTVSETEAWQWDAQRNNRRYAA